LIGEDIKWNLLITTIKNCGKSLPKQSSCSFIGTNPRCLKNYKMLERRKYYYLSMILTNLIIQGFMNYPKVLYKYGTFQNYTIDMIDNNYLYMCPANNLDDQFECGIDLRHYNGVNMNYIIDLVRHALGYNNIKLTDIQIKNCFINNKIEYEKLKKYILRTKHRPNRYKMTCLRKMITTISNINKLTGTKGVEKALKKLYFLKDEIGICSLTPDKNNQVMWSMYANNYNGYCIEYDIEKTITNNQNKEKDFLEVRYKEQRESDPLKIIVKELQSVIEKTLKQEKAIVDKKVFESLVYNIITTKHPDWSFQREWRFIGRPNEKIHSYIKAVYLGKNFVDDNSKILIKKCREKNIPVFRQIDDKISLSLRFEKI